MTRFPFSAALLLVTILFGASSIGLAGPQAEPPESESAEWMLREAERQEAGGDLEAAIRDYGLLIDHFPATPAGGQALLRLARIHWRRGDLGAAEERARRVSLDHQGTPWGAGGLFILGELQAARASDLNGLDDAGASFRNVWMFYPRQTLPALNWRSAARVRYGELALLQRSDIAAANAFIGALEDEGLSEWTPRAALGLATVLADRGDWLAAAETLQEARNRMPPAVSRAVLRRLTLIHRSHVRPLADLPRWRRSRPITAANLRLERPSRVAAAEDGRLAVTDASGSVLTLLDGDETSSRLDLRTQDSRPSWGSRGSLHIPLETGIFTIGGQNLNLYEPGKPGQALKEVRAAERGAFGWWVLSNRRVLRFGVDGAFEAWVSQSPDDRPADLAQDHRGRLYVLDQKHRSVFRIEADGGARRTVVTGDWTRPEAVTVDALGNIYVLDQKNRRIEVFDTHGTKVAVLGPMLPGGVELKAPRDIAVDGAGRLFVSDVKRAEIIVLE